MACIRAGDWRGVARLMLTSARKVAQAGAQFAICPDNTIHQAYQLMIGESPLPWLHIAEVVAEEAKRSGFMRVGIMVTKFLMAGPVYPEALRKFGLSYEMPEKEDQERINQIIFSELVNGVFREESRLYFNRVMQRFKQRGCEAAVLGCTEIPLIVNPDDCPLPTLDSTRLLARAALKRALEAD